MMAKQEPARCPDCEAIVDPRIPGELDGCGTQPESDQVQR